MLRGMDSVQDFDERLFGILVERVRVMNLVQVDFVLWSGIRMAEVLG